MEQETEIRNCNVCSCEFDLNGEGGIDGFIGILLVAFCPTCLAGIMDMATQLLGIGDTDEEDGSCGCHHCMSQKEESEHKQIKEGCEDAIIIETIS